jgi:hypothetical protein
MLDKQQKLMLRAFCLGTRGLTLTSRYLNLHSARTKTVFFANICVRLKF